MLGDTDSNCLPRPQIRIEQRLVLCPLYSAIVTGEVGRVVTWTYRADVCTLTACRSSAIVHITHSHRTCGQNAPRHLTEINHRFEVDIHISATRQRDPTRPEIPVQQRRTRMPDQPIKVAPCNLRTQRSCMREQVRTVGCKNETIPALSFGGETRCQRTRSTLVYFNDQLVNLFCQESRHRDSHRRMLRKVVDYHHHPKHRTIEIPDR